MLQYEGFTYDLDSLFQFEMLKKIIEALAKRQFEIDKKLSIINNPATSHFESLLNSPSLTNDDPSRIDNSINPEDYNSRICLLENKLKNLPIIESWLKALDQKTASNTQTLSFLQSDLSNLTDRINSGEFSSNNNADPYDNLPVDEVENDDNIKYISNDNNSLDKDTLVVLENKVFKKFNLIDTKFKQIDNNIKRMQNDIKRNNALINNNSNYINELTSMLSELKSNFDNFLKNNAIKMEDFKQTLENQFNAKLDPFIKETNEQITQLQENFNTNYSNLNDICTTLSNKQRENSALTNSIYNKVKELETNIPIMLNDLGIKRIANKLSNLENEIKTKSSNEDFENQTKTICEVKTILTSLTTFKQCQDELNEKRAQDITAVRTKIETLNNTLGLLQTENSNIKSQNNSLNSKGYLDINLFNDAIKSINIQIDQLHRESDEYRRNFTDILPLMGKLASITDLKNLEDVLKAMLEEYKLMGYKRFADKTEMHKSLKLLDTQIKHLIAEYIKKQDKGETWMIASKPVGGFKCASCESYIGELNNKWEYLPWNKYPTRDYVDKSYRMGNGFSRMLQKLNLDVRRSDEINTGTIGELSFDEGNCGEKDRNLSSERVKEKRKGVKGLPKIKTMQCLDGGNIEHTSSANEQQTLSKKNLEENETGSNNANTIQVSNKVVKKAISKQKEPRLLKIMKKAKINTGNNFYGNVHNRSGSAGNSRDKIVIEIGQ